MTTDEESLVLGVFGSVHVAAMDGETIMTGVCGAVRTGDDM